jgi:hypothetical protein
MSHSFLQASCARPQPQLKEQIRNTAHNICKKVQHADLQSLRFQTASRLAIASQYA